MQTFDLSTKILPSLDCCHDFSIFLCIFCNASDKKLEELACLESFEFYTSVQNKTMTESNKEKLIDFFIETKFEFSEFNSTHYDTLIEIIGFIPLPLRIVMTNMFANQLEE